ncbi:MAG: transketolase, partial [Desulfobulbaceae bacterium]|nr:transketolase [Desulfobulbaceae bacterium]
GQAAVESLMHYREYGHGLYGHPERHEESGVFFSSGRLGHLWSYVNGVAEANPGKNVFLFGSDGSQQEGDDAEAARYAVARGLNVKLLLDDNNVTIAGHPSDYMAGFDLDKTLGGHGLTTLICDGEDFKSLYTSIQQALTTPGPVAVIIKRPMAPGVAGIEGSPKGHDVIAVDLAVQYLHKQDHAAAADLLQQKPAKAETIDYLGSTAESVKNRDDFGKIVVDLLKNVQKPQEKVLVVDSDLEGSCGLHHIRKALPELYVHGGIMERNNFSVAAGFGSEPGRQGIFGTFAAFQEMVISEITMARLNKANVLAHFSHSGVDEMADNTCHFGINNFFADNGLAEGDNTRLYFPADALQLRAIMESIFWNPGLRFVYSTRSGTPFILNEQGEKFFGEGYRFKPDEDEIIREGKDGYIVSYGEMLYRVLHVVEGLKKEGISLGLVNKPVLNVADETMLTRLGKSPMVLVVESQNAKTGLGIRFGTWLLERGYAPKYGYMGSWKEGAGGISEQIPHQGLGPDGIRARVQEMLQSSK